MLFYFFQFTTMAKVKIEEHPDCTIVSFLCEGCKHDHVVPVTGSKAWGFNSNVDSPTITPSILNTTGSFAQPGFDDGDIPPTRCHIFVRDGQIQFLADCTHDMKNRTIDLPEINK